MRTILLNTSIVTAPGHYRYVALTLEGALSILQSGDHAGYPLISAIGHQSTADILTDLLCRNVPVNRIEYKAEPGDVAIVFKLRGRPPEGKILTREEIEAIGYDFGVLYRDA